MLISLELVFATLALILAGLASFWALKVYIYVEAAKQATHTVIPITPESAVTKLENHLNDVASKAGANQADLNRGFHDLGLDPEELV